MNDIAAMVLAAVAALSALASLWSWSTRRIVREELFPLRADVKVLRAAVFNHLAHGHRPDEADIRAALGLPRGR